MFAPLHCKSEYSLGYGTATVEELVDAAADYGYPAIGLTDIENLYGQVRFHHAARAAGIKPITGVELRTGVSAESAGRKEGRVILLARNRAGYSSLCRIVSRRRLGDPAYGPSGECAVEPTTLLRICEPGDLYVLSDDSAALCSLVDLGADCRYLRFLLVPYHIAECDRVRLVADPDVVMLSPDDGPFHRLLAAIRQCKTVYMARHIEDAERSLPPSDLLRDVFDDASIDETLRVADDCSLDLREAATISPASGVGDAAAQLAEICRARLAAARLDGRLSGFEYDDRVVRELATLSSLGFSDYFLIVGEIVDRARSRGIAILGRGSATGSLVAYLIGITQVDPIRHDLLFERFIHSDRRDMPDIDVDVASDRRDELIDWVFRRFGRDRVAMACAHVTFQRRLAYRDGLKALGLGPADIARFSELMPSDDIESEAAPPLPLNLLPERIRESVPLIERLIGRMRHVSVHPGGIVIAPDRLDEYTPLERAPKGVVVTQYDMRSLAKLGLLKIDLLGNRALAAVEEAERLIGHPADAPDGDPATLELIREAQTIGCFQIETPATRSLLRKVPMRGIDDLTAVLALIRPGPASGEAKSAYVRRAYGEEQADAPHAVLAHLLESTFGMLLYEEDLVRAIAALTGWSLEKSDQVRADLIKSADNSDVIGHLASAFVEAAVGQGVNPSEACSIWQRLIGFAAYTFNKAHAASYAQLAWRTAFLKAHHPLEFACATLNHYGGGYPIRTIAADVMRSGIELMPPDLNMSAERCEPQRGGIRVGLAMVRRLTIKSRSAILANRPFRGLGNLLRLNLPYREMESLMLSGACDSLKPLTPENYPFVHEKILAQLRAQRVHEGGHSAEGHPAEEFSPTATRGAQLETYRRLVRVRNELTFLDMAVTEHPMAVLRLEAARVGCIPVQLALSKIEGFVKLAGIIAASRRVVARGGKVMQFVTLEDETGSIETVLFQSAYVGLDDPVRNPGPFIVAGRLAQDHNDVHLLVSTVSPFHERSAPFQAT